MFIRDADVIPVAKGHMGSCPLAEELLETMYLIELHSRREINS